VNTETIYTNQNYSTYGFPGTIFWGVVISIACIITQVIAVAVYIGVTHSGVEASEYESLLSDIQFNGTLISIATFAGLLVGGGMIIAAIKFKRGSNIRHYLALNSVSMRELKYWALVAAAFVVCSDSLTYFLDKPLVPEFMSSVYSSAESKWLLWVAIVVAAPLFEELFFRGFIISGLSSSFVGPIGAILISSISWAAIHLQYDMYGIATIFALGLILGAARLKTGSVVLTIVLHSCVNLIATIQAAYYVP